MKCHAFKTDVLPRRSGTRLLIASLIVAGSALLTAKLSSLGFSPLTGAAVLAAAGLGGGLILRDHVRVPGLPLLAAAIAAGSVLVAVLLGGSIEVTGAGVIFMALLVATNAPTRTSGLMGTAILAAAQVLAALI